MTPNQLSNAAQGKVQRSRTFSFYNDKSVVGQSSLIFQLRGCSDTYTCLPFIHSLSVSLCLSLQIPLSLSLALHSYISLPLSLISVSVSIFRSTPISHPCGDWFPEIYSLSPQWKTLPGNNRQSSSCHRTYTS